MTKISSIGKSGSSSDIGAVAQIANLDIVSATLEQLLNRRPGMSGLGCLFGPSGWGKSFSSNTLANETSAYYVQMKSTWSAKDFLCKILIEMKVPYLFKKSTGEFSTTVPSVTTLLDLVTEQLSLSRKMLIIDEFDYAVEKPRLVALTRDIYEGSQGSILMVGEELLPQKLKAWEKFHSRVSSWAQAQPVSVSDAIQLRPIYCPNVVLPEDVLKVLTDKSKGSVRRMVNYFGAIDVHVLNYGLSEITLKSLEGVALTADDAPVRRF